MFSLQVKEFRDLQVSDQLALGGRENGEEGIFVYTEAFARPRPAAEKFAFRTHVSRETAFHRLRPALRLIGS
jgi:hypothetical protein